MKNRIFTVFVLLIFTFIAVPGFCADTGGDSLLKTITTDTVTHSTTLNHVAVDPISVDISTVTANRPQTDTAPNWLTYLITLLLSLYEFFVHLIPTTNNYSIIRFVAWVLQQLSDWLNRKKKKHPDRFI